MKTERTRTHKQRNAKTNKDLVNIVVGGYVKVKTHAKHEHKS